MCQQESTESGIGTQTEISNEHRARIRQKAFFLRTSAASSRSGVYHGKGVTSLGSAGQDKQGKPVQVFQPLRPRQGVQQRVALIWPVGEMAPLWIGLQRLQRGGLQPDTAGQENGGCAADGLLNAPLLGSGTIQLPRLKL